ncbi:MAG: hypothetical protein WC556_00070 [Candidatus Methanoperedens sp.]
MKIRLISGCAVGKGLFSSFAGFEKSNILPLWLVTECREKLTRNCSEGICPRFRIGFKGSHKISWRKEGARI